MKLIPLILRVVPRPVLISISYFIMRFTGFLYRGKNVECPVCGHSFRKLLPYGYNKVREGVLCPRCFSLERHRLLWLFLKNETPFFKANLRVLHVAPEQCFYRRFRSMKNLDYTTGDLGSPLADIKLDIQSMPFENNSFDVVICNHVLEHVHSDIKALNEIYRIIRQGGFAILQVPFDITMKKTHEDSSVTDPREREKHFRQKDHLRLYGKDFPDRVRQAGFITRDGNYTEKVDENMKKRFRLPENEFMYAFYK